MSKVTIIDDTFNIIKNDEKLVVRRISDYIKTYSLIQDAIYNKKDLKVIIKNRYCVNLFKAMQKMYGDKYIEIYTYSPINELSKTLNVSVPDYITEKDILDSGLNLKGEELQFVNGLEFEDIIISNYLNPFLANKKFPFKLLISILHNLDFEMVKENLKLNIVSKVYRRKIDLWKEDIKEEHESNIFDMFIKNPKKLYELAYKYLLLCNYPDSLGIKVIGAIYKDFDKLNIENEIFIDNSINLLSLRDNIRIYLSGIPTDNLKRQEILKTLGMVTGILEEEFIYFIYILKTNICEVDEYVIKEVRSKFKRIKDGINEFDEILDNIIPPPLPGVPSENFNIENWIAWAQNEYLRYRFWMEENNQYNENIDTYATLYGDWVYNNYIDLISSEELMIYKAFTNIGSELKENELSLILVIDNFNYKYVTLIQELFLEEGYNTTINKSLISMLPSETSVSKVSLFSGEPYANDYKKPYEKICNEFGNAIGRAVKYVSDIGGIKQEFSKNADVYIVNYLEIDNILHRNQKDFAQSTRTKIKEELKALVRVITNFSKRLEVENTIKIYVFSDHGSTKIITNQTNLISKELYKGKCDDETHRYITVTDENVGKLGNNIDTFCYVVDRHKYGTKENYLIAKSYYRFIETDENFYVHGGITPEETIVPFLKFEKIDSTVKFPYVMLKVNEFRHAVKSRIILEVSNANEYPISDMEIEILNSNIKTFNRKRNIEIINGLVRNEVIFDDVRVMTDTSSQQVLSLLIMFNFLGNQYQKEYKLDIIIKTLQQNKIDFDSLF